MKISTKFVSLSVTLVGAIALISGGSTLWRNHIQETTHERYTQAQRRIQAATLVQNRLYAEIIELKDHILFRNIDEEKEDEFDVGIEEALDELESVVSTPEIKYIRARQEIFEELEENVIEGINQGLIKTEVDIKADFRAINGFMRDIDFFLGKLSKQAQQQADEAEKELERVEAIATNVSYSTIVLLMLMVLGLFWVVLRPTIQSLKQLQEGANEIGMGNLSHRMEIHTQDEIEQLSQAFNRMAESLGISQVSLQQKLEEIEVARAAAETANRAKSQFLANMNHELRTPLNGILGYVQILQRDTTTNEKQIKGFRVIHQCASHLLTLINDILDLSKLEAQKMELYPQDFHFANFLASTADICRIKAEQKGVEFKFQPGANLPTAIHADDKRLRQVLLNLLSNSVKFTDFGKVSFRIEVVDDTSTDCERIRRIRFQVKDTGIGIVPEKLASIFLPFEQAGKRERNIEGTGLGLAISQQIIEKMGSSIQVESTFGQGSCFWFELDLPLVSEWFTGDAIANQTIIGYEGERRKILVVDDREENRLVAVNMLEPLGFELAEAENGQKALDIALEMSPDLIITDVHMAVMDGLEMTRRLRQISNFTKTPIIASPATLSKVDMQDSLDAGCSSFFPKPLDLNGLLAEIQRLLKLQWISETKPNTLVLENNHHIDGEELVFPPPAELAALYTAVQGGFMSEVQQEANRLKQLAPKYIPLANQILELTQQFDDEAILRLLEPWV
ncbi:ATP-binding protein [Calothrix sp. PCC 6303]|uniref:ATP-binding protein n=1 Tax=Calothrix sp. PCC 6303 TaxID=1170562 RepID=UPI0002A04297|nr:ATP-binding protein [Calothrix sp. PCC 6303]AFZ02597.1 integral membrane sensor hybrid histidine kinase [Calothrix sp. PCC 6303]